MEKENTNETSTNQRLKHLNDEKFYDEQIYSSYSKYSRRDRKSRHSNKMSSSNKTTKPYSSEYTAFNSGSSNQTHFDDTMFPFDRAALAYDASENTIEWTNKHSSAHPNNYSDSTSPDFDYYEQFRSSATQQSTTSNATVESRQMKEMTSIPRKQSLKMSKYELPTSPSSINNDQNHQLKNHISESDAFNLPIANTNVKTSSSSPDNTTTAIPNNTISFGNANQSSITNVNDRNPVSQFEQIASKFDKIPSKVPPHDCKYWQKLPLLTLLFTKYFPTHSRAAPF